ncbi:T-cell surface antigen CD2 [Caloenas nicobarica]|uniref:T-cell surface antigen CD2 n=1 Tax=Caloenas nicobarica TaxID=187106 RepID=UPI0032B820E6
MNFWRIFLIKYMLLLFPSVKCSVSNLIYTAVNESVFLHIAVAAENVYDATWLRDRKKLLQLKDSKVKYYVNRDQCRCKIFLNGTLQIERVVKEDSGKYTVTVYQKDGKLSAEEDKTFIVQEPVAQPILSFECINKSASVKCEVKQKTKDETFIIELTQDKSKKIQKNATRVELHTQYSGMFRCVVKNQVSEKVTEKVIKCSGQLDLYLILSIAGGAIFFVIFVILLICCIRKKKAERLGDYVAGTPQSDSSLPEEDQAMQAHQADSEMVVRELPQPPSNPTPKQLRIQQRPLPQPQGQQQAVPPRPRPRTQQRTPNHPRERP